MRERVAELVRVREPPSPPTGSTRSSCSAWADRASRPEVLAPNVRRDLAARARHDAPDRDPRARGAHRPRPDAVRRPRRSPARRSRRARTPTTSGRRPARASSGRRSPIPAPRSRRSPASAGSAASSTASRRSAAATRRCRRSGSSPPRSRASTSTALLASAEAMAERCRRDEGNPGYELGRAFGTGWTEGRDKICIADTPGGFGLWAEQLIAESTGKQGKGLVPAPGESPDGPDRQAGRAGASPTRVALGGEFFRWEFAVAVAGDVPGDQPVRPARRPGGEGQDERGPRDRQGAGARAGGVGGRARRAGG